MLSPLDVDKKRLTVCRMAFEGRLFICIYLDLGLSLVCQEEYAEKGEITEVSDRKLRLEV